MKSSGSHLREGGGRCRPCEPHCRSYSAWCVSKAKFFPEFADLHLLCCSTYNLPGGILRSAPIAFVQVGIESRPQRYKAAEGASIASDREFHVTTTLVRQSIEEVR